MKDWRSWMDSAGNRGLSLLSFDYEQYYEAMYCAVAAYKDGALEEDQLERSSSRLEQSRRR